MRTVDRWIHELGRKLAAVPRRPHEVALAFSVGIFIGVVPGIGVATALLVAIVFRLNNTATILGSLVNNPWTAAFLFAASFKTGRWLLGPSTPVEWRRLLTFQSGWPHEFGDVVVPTLVGSSLLGLAGAVAAYWVVRLFLSHLPVSKKSSSTSH